MDKKRISFACWLGLVAATTGCQFDLGGEFSGPGSAGRMVFTNAADFSTAIAPGSVATAWGIGLQNTRTLRVTYAEIEGMPQQIVEVIPSLIVDTQINFVVPTMNLPSSMGGMIEALDEHGGLIDKGWIGLSSAAPALFVDGKSLPAGYAIARKNLPDGKFEDTAINYFKPELTEFVPIQQIADELFLVLYGEGGQPAGRAMMSEGKISYVCSSSDEKRAVINGRVEIPILSWGSASWAGVDQINLRVTNLIPQILASQEGSGVQNLKLMVRDCFGNWKESRSVKLRFAAAGTASN